MGIEFSPKDEGGNGGVSEIPRFILDKFTSAKLPYHVALKIFEKAVLGEPDGGLNGYVSFDLKSTDGTPKPFPLITFDVDRFWQDVAARADKEISIHMGTLVDSGQEVN